MKKYLIILSIFSIYAVAEVAVAIDVSGGMRGFSKSSNTNYLKLLDNLDSTFSRVSQDYSILEYGKKLVLSKKSMKDFLNIKKREKIYDKFCGDFRLLFDKNVTQKYDTIFIITDAIPSYKDKDSQSIYDKNMIPFSINSWIRDNQSMNISSGVIGLTSAFDGTYYVEEKYKYKSQKDWKYKLNTDRHIYLFWISKNKNFTDNFLDILEKHYLSGLKSDSYFIQEFYKQHLYQNYFTILKVP